MFQTTNNKRKAELRQKLETFLDAGYVSCVLQEPEVAAGVVDTWQHFDDEECRLIEWVVMPNHYHILIEPFEDVPLAKIVLSWKNFTARFINKYKSRFEERQFQGAKVWQRDYCDRFIHDERHFEAARNCIAMNPVKAGLAAQPEDWLWSSAKERIGNDGKS